MDRATQLYAHLWATKYAPAYAEQRAAEEQRRAEAFVDAPRLVAGSLIRPLTGYDLLILDGYDHPLVGSPARATTTTPAELAWFLWYQRATDPDLETEAIRSRVLRRYAYRARGWRGFFVPPPPEFSDAFLQGRRRENFIRRCRRAWLDRAGQPTEAYAFGALPEALAYIEAAFADNHVPTSEPAPGEPVASRPSGTAFLAPIVIGLACETGWAESFILNLPLARLWQYLREIRERRSDKPTIDASASAVISGDCLAEVNAILAGQLPDPLAT